MLGRITSNIPSISRHFGPKRRRVGISQVRIAGLTTSHFLSVLLHLLKRYVIELLLSKSSRCVASKLRSHFGT